MRRIVIVMIGVLWANAMAAKSFELKSPSGEVSVTVDIGEQIRYSVYGGGKPLLTDSSLALCLREGPWATSRTSPVIRQAL